MVKVMTLTFRELNILQKFLSNRVDFDFFIEVIARTYVMDHEHLEHWERFQNNPISYITSQGQVGQELYDKVVLEIDKRNYNG